MNGFSRRNAIPTTAKQLKELREAAPKQLPTVTKGINPLLYPYKQELTIDEIDETVLARIEQAICWQWPTSAICQHAGITAKLFNQLKKIPELRERFDVLTQRPELVARRNIAMDLEVGEVGTSKWFLERKTKDFAPKQQIDHNVKQEVDEVSVLSALEKLVLLSQQRKAEQTAHFNPIIEHQSSDIDPLLL